MLQIYNTLTQRKENFLPRVSGQVGIYLCGMTVYDAMHIGHARCSVVFDTVIRFLRAQNYSVTYVRNITDIEDKIIKRARANNETTRALTERMIAAMQADMAALNILPPTFEPRATAHVQDIIALIARLLNTEHAYIATNGDVYYAVSKFAAYGQLSHQDPQALRAGARVEISEHKRDPLDFVLWKITTDEPHWASPWGNGRPGWHIECSAMALHCLGEQFDIHGGGFDLIFPHHQNEIAQTEGATGKSAVQTWMHIGFVQVDKAKMSKSLNNFFTVREVLQAYSAEALRYFLISSHYRSPINYSAANLTSAQQALTRFYTALRDLQVTTDNFAAAPNIYERRFNAALNDDFNTPEALAVLFDLTRELNRLRATDLAQAVQLAAQLRRLGAILGLLQLDPSQFLQAGEADETVKIEQLIAARNAARAQRDWTTADQLRQQLTELKIIIEDNNGSTQWRRT